MSANYSTRQVKTSFQYTDLNRYTPSLGISSEAAGMNGDMGNGSGPLSSNIQIVPVFSGVNYQHPNYNSLTGRSYAPYDRVNSAYLSRDCVKYVTQQVGVQSGGGMMTPTPGPVVIVLIIIGLVLRSARKRKNRRPSGVPTPVPYIPSIIGGTTPIPLASSSQFINREDNEQNINATIYRSLQNYTDKVQDYDLNSPKEYPYLMPPANQQPISFPDPNGTYTSSLNIQNLI